MFFLNNLQCTSLSPLAKKKEDHVPLCSFPFPFSENDHLNPMTRYVFIYSNFLLFPHLICVPPLDIVFFINLYRVQRQRKKNQGEK